MDETSVWASDLIYEGGADEVAAGRHALLAGHKFLGGLQKKTERMLRMFRTQ